MIDMWLRQHFTFWDLLYIVEDCRSHTVSIAILDLVQQCTVMLGDSLTRKQFPTFNIFKEKSMDIFKNTATNLKNIDKPEGYSKGHKESLDK